MSWRRRSLGARMAAIAAVNLALLAVIVFLAAGVPIRLNPLAVFRQAVNERMLDVTRQVALDLERTSPGQADALLLRYERDYHAHFLLVTNDGTPVAGAPLRLPDEVLRALQGPPPGEARGPRPAMPPPDRGGRPGPPGGFEPPIEPGGPRLPQTPPFHVNTAGGPNSWYGVRIPIRFAGEADIRPGTLLIAPTSLLASPLYVPVRWLWGALAALAVTLACWWPFLGGLTRSLGRMALATDRIAHGRFDTALGIRRRDEVGYLAASIEDMAARLKSLVEGQKRFLGDTAHELRSPLGRMQVALEILDGRVGAGDRKYVADLREDVTALAALTDDLLQYARAELQGRELPLVTVPIADIVHRVVAREGRADVEIRVRVPADTSVLADPTLFERALANVVRNAVRYAGAAGPIQVAAEATSAHVMVMVSDAGPGVDPAALTRVFDPFFRVDAARDRKTGGVGLGLAIVRSAVEACGGTVSCRNVEPRGLEVRMEFQKGRP